MSATKFAAALRASMRKQGVKVPDLSRATGLSANIIYGYTGGVYVPTLPNAAKLADALMDDNLLWLAKAARYRKCQLTSCRRPYWADRGPQKFCSPACTTLAAKGLERTAPDAAQDAIDEMCRGCEPAGVCRNDGCPLRRFSPFPFGDGDSVPYIGDPARAERRAVWREKWQRQNARPAA